MQVVTDTLLNDLVNKQVHDIIVRYAFFIPMHNICTMLVQRRRRWADVV